MELILIRHGLPEMGVGVEGERADAPLSMEGRAQANRLAGWLADEEIDRVYASPMARARQTAMPLAGLLGHEIAISAGVAEYGEDLPGYASLEGVRQPDGGRYRGMLRDNGFGGGDPEGFRARVVEALEEIVMENRGRRVAVVCHGSVINSWASHVLGMDRVFFFQPAYTSINRFLAAASGERIVMTLNEHAHLRD